MANRVAALTTFATTAPPWSLALLDANFSALFAAANDSSLGWANGVPTDSGSVNNYVVALPYGAPTAYNPGFSVTFIPLNSNTGPSNISVAGLGSVPIVDVFGNPLMAGYLVAGKAAQIQYTGTNFRLLNSSQSGGVSYYYDYDDFIHNSYFNSGPPQVYGTKLLASWGTGNYQAYATSIAGHPGIWQLQTGATNYSILAQPVVGDVVNANNGGPLFLDGTTSLLMRSIVQPNLLSANVDFTFGLWNIHANALATGTHQFLGFVGNLNRNANWLAYANASNTAITSTSTGIALTAGTWYTLEFAYNAATGVVTYYVNNVSVATVSANLPAAATPLYPTFQVLGNSGGTSSYLIDTYEFQANPGTPNRFLYGAI